MTDTIEARWEAHNEAGRRYFGQGDYANAEQAFVAAIREASELGDNNVRLASSLSNFGQLKYKQKDLGQAEALFRRALAIRESVLGAEHFGLVQNLNNLAALHYARGELDLAEPLFRRALQISEQALGEAHPDVGVTLNNLARLYFRRNDYDAAAPLLLRLLAIKQETLGASHPEVAAILTSLAKVRFAEGDFDAGEQLARRALAIREQIHVPNDPAIATSLETLAEICGARGKRDEEIDLRGRALAIREGSMGVDHPTVVAARASLATRRVSAEFRVPLDSPVPLRTPEQPASVVQVPAPPAPPIVEVLAAPGLFEFPPTPALGTPAVAAASTVEPIVLDSNTPAEPAASERAPLPALEIAPLIDMPEARPAAAAPPAPPPVAPQKPVVPPISGSRSAAAPPAPRRPSAPVTSPPTTTKTRSLPWIEPPNSELVLSRTQPAAPRPAAPKPAAPIVPPAAPPPAPPPRVEAPRAEAPRAEAPLAATPHVETRTPTPPRADEPLRKRTPAPASDVIEVGGGSRSKTPAESYANLMTHATADGIERARIEVVTGVQPAIRSEVSLEDYHIPQKKSWIGKAAAVIIIGALIAGGYMLYQRLALARSGKDLSPATSAAGTVAGNRASKPLAAESVMAPIVQKAAPPAPEPARPPAPAPVRPPAPAPVPEEDLGAPTTRKGVTLPTVNLDRITQAISDSARAHVDSANKGLGVNPPTFKPGTPPR